MLVLALVFATAARSETLPVVTPVELQPLAAQVDRVVEALEMLGQPLPGAVKDRLTRARQAPDPAVAVRELQQVLDEQCLIGITINPESRVKAVQGPASPSLMQQGWRVFLVKVQNEAGVTAELRAMSPNAAPLYRRSTGSPQPKRTIPLAEVPQRWMDVTVFRDRPMKPALSGLNVEYCLLQIYSRDAGPREAKIKFDVGQGTQDLGFRSDVDILFHCAAAVPVVLDVHDEDGRPVMASFSIRDALGRVYPAQSRRLAPDLFFHPQIYRQTGEDVLLPPGKYTVEYTRGPEYLTLQKTIDVPAAKSHTERFTLKRHGRAWPGGTGSRATITSTPPAAPTTRTRRRG